MPSASESRAVNLTINGKQRSFDIDDPKLPDWIDDRDLSSGGYPYEDKLKKDKYEKQLEALQVELVKMQFWLQALNHACRIGFAFFLRL